MKIFKTVFAFILLLVLHSCGPGSEPEALEELVRLAPSIAGKPEYLDSPFVTAGDRVYMVGHQNGSFPELGWHIKGEMGGIWNHPIKLMDGFSSSIHLKDTAFLMDNASLFKNYPFANSHHFEWPDKNLKAERWQFVPDGTEGMIVQFVLANTGTEDMELEFAITGHSDLRPTWLSEELGISDGKDQAEYLAQDELWLVKDEENPWFVAYGTNPVPDSHSLEASPYSGNGTSGRLLYQLHLAAGETRYLNLAIAGSYKSREEAVQTFWKLQGQWKEELLGKKLRYEALAAKSKLSIPDKRIEQTFEWLKYNCDWLIRTVPEIGTGITAGIPDYPWWFGVDSEYALKGYMAIGQTDAVYRTIELLDSVSMAVNGNGRILHEMSTNGVVFNKGNINETPQFASLIWEVYRWNGDKSFLKKYFPTVKKGLEWLMEEKDENKNLFPDGFGMMEIHGLDSEMIDVAVYTQRAFSDAARMAAQLGETELARDYQETADGLKIRINRDFWSPQFSSYADFIGTDTQALHLIEDAIIRADTLQKPWAVKELEQTAEQIRKNPSSLPRPFVLHHNWVVNTPMEMGIADSSKAILALQTAEKFVNPFGLFVTGIDRDETAGTDEGSFQGSKVFSYTGAVMTLPTGVQAVAENNYGRPDKALEYLERMSRGFSYALPGSMYEVSPDYGMMTQAWNIYGYAIPIIQQFFGLQPEAYEKRIRITPQMPSSWDKASVEDVEVAGHSVSVYWASSDGRGSLRIVQDTPDWELEVVLPDKANRDYKVGEGQVLEDISEGNRIFISDSKTLTIEWTEAETQNP